MNLAAGMRFVVASSSPAAAFAGWLLSQAGATVEHVSALDPEGLGAFLVQRGRFAPEPLDAVIAAGLPPGATLVTDAPQTAANRALLEREARERLVAWITPYGVDADLPGELATDLCLHAAGGWMYAVGEPGREPLGPTGAQGRLVAGQFAAIAALATVLPGGQKTGLVDLAIVEAIAATCIYDSVSYQYLGVGRKRAGRRFSYGNSTLVTLPCKDGYAGVHAALHRQFVALCGLIGKPEMVSDVRFAAPAQRAANAEAMDSDAFLPWLAGRTRWEAYHAMQGARVASAALPTMAEVLASPQLAAREAWDEVTTPSGRLLRVPGAPARVVCEAPGIGRHREDGPWAPGALRVVDLSMGWAGPLVSHILSCLGADVIKLEGPNRFDWWRGSRPPGDDPALALHERSSVFNTANRGKRGITLDLQSAAGNAIAHRLIASADVLVENFSAGVMERLGLTYARLSADNPGLIMLQQPGFGSTGPESSYVAFGNTIEGMAGLTQLMGYEGGAPQMMSNAFGDPVSGLNGTIAVLAALAARNLDGRGRCIEAAQLEGFLGFVAEGLLEYQASGEQPARRGNRRPGHEPAGLFPCAGDDQWAAIEVRSDREWATLATATGEPWARDPALATAAGRAARREHIGKKLAAWTVQQDRDELVTKLTAAGVPAAPLHTEADLLAWGLLAERGFFAPQERAFVGTHLYPSLPLVVDSARPLPSRPAPILGEHDAEVLGAMGYGEAELARLRADGVTGGTAVPAVV